MVYKGNCTPLPRGIKSSSDAHIKSDVASSLEASDLHNPVVKEEIQWSNLMLLPHSKPRCARKRSSGEIAAKLQANQIVFVSDKKQRGPFPSPPRCARKRSSGERLAKELKSKPLFLSEIVEPQPGQIVFGSEMRTRCNKKSSIDWGEKFEGKPVLMFVNSLS